MRRELLVTNRRCNQACAFCDRRAGSDDRSLIAYDAVVARARALVESGAEEIVVTGGEPTLRRDLDRIIAAVRRAGRARIVLETNATVIDAPRAEALRAAGVDVVRIHMPGWGETYDRSTRDAGSFAGCLSGVDALLAARVRLELSVPIVARGLDEVSLLPSRFAERFGPRALEAILVEVPSEAPDPRELVAPARAAQVIETLAEAVATRAVALRIRPGAAVTPCLFRHPRRLSGAFELSRSDAPHQDGWRHLAACEACLLADACPGLPVTSLERHGTPAVTPIRDDLTRRRLTLYEPPDGVARRMLMRTQAQRRPDGETSQQHVVRVLYRCNQACHFCFVPTFLEARPVDEVRAAIAEAAAAGGSVALSGGEPTLHPDLVELVRFAVERSRAPVELQTNAVLLDDPARVRALRDAGLGLAFVSLHGSCAEVSDRVTGAPGTWVRTVVGIDGLLAAGVPVAINFVLCGANHHDLPATVRLVAERWPSARFTLSYVAASTDLVPRDAETIPRYSDVARSLAAAVTLATTLTVEIAGLDSMCAMPLCTLPEGLLDWRSLADAAVPSDERLFVRAPACEGCAARSKCWGVRPVYAQLHGLSELIALR